jgi:O-methyltransferase
MMSSVFVRSLVHRVLLRYGMDLAPVGDGKSHLDHIRRGMSETTLLLNGFEAYQLMEMVRATASVPGDIAEVGVFRGASAKLICAVKENRPLHLFDTFEGLPDLTVADTESPFAAKAYSAQLEAVKRYVGPCPQVEFYQGLFPATAGPVENRKFSFVHVDVDLYEATRASLEWFYPRLSPGAIVMCHDFHYPGVKKAVHEALEGKPERPISQSSGSHCLILKQG